MGIFHKPHHQFLQVLAATIFILLVVLSLYASSTDPIFWIIGGGAIAASTMLVFLDPHSKTASPHNIFWSYIIALIVTLVIRFILNTFIPELTLTSTIFVIPTIIIVITITMFIVYYLFSLLHLTHPPACGLIFVLVVHDTGYYKFITIIVAGIILSVISKIMKANLEDIIE